MSDDLRGGAAAAAELRRAFDAGFAQAPPREEVAHEDLLAIRLGSSPYAVRLSEVAEILVDRRVTPLPSALPELLGVVSARGAILPVYHLRAVLGLPGAPEAGRWLLVTARAPVALAFDQCEGRFRTPREAVVRDTGGAGTHEIVSADLLLRPVLHLPAVLETIDALVRQRATPRSDER